MATAWLFHDSLVRQARLSRQPSCYRVNLCHLIGLLIASSSNVLICGLLLKGEASENIGTDRGRRLWHGGVERIHQGVLKHNPSGDMWMRIEKIPQLMLSIFFSNHMMSVLFRLDKRCEMSSPILFLFSWIKANFSTLKYYRYLKEGPYWCPSLMLLLDIC